jgi:hypothetical protein
MRAKMKISILKHLRIEPIQLNFLYFSLVVVKFQFKPQSKDGKH